MKKPLFHSFLFSTPLSTLSLVGCVGFVFANLILFPLPLSAAEPKVSAAPTSSVEAVDENVDGPVINDIRIEGAQRLERDTVLSYLTVAVGSHMGETQMDESLKALYATGLFSDVKLAMDGNTLWIKVDENSIVNRVAFEGNDKISDDDLKKEVQLQPRLVYTLPKVQQDVQRILDLYRREGRFAATVDPKIVRLDQNRVDVVFEIAEGKHTGVRRINFVGNNKFDEGDLKAVVNTQESAWWKFFSNSDFYDPDRTNYDRELLRRFYLSQGYVDFRVVSAVAEMTPDRSDFFLTFTLDEGPRYKFGKIDIISDIKGLDGETLRQDIMTKQDDWYDADKVERSIAKLVAVLGDKQYAFVDIVPETKKDKDTLVVDLTYHIKPGERVYIGRIDITGNTRTLDKVVRREMQVAEGDPFSTSRVKRSEQKIKDLGFFEEVKVTPKSGEQPDRSDINVEVKEKSTGEISLGAGYSSTDGPLGDFSIRERNFLGRGQDVRLGATISGVTKQFDFGFTEPYFLDRDLSAGFDIFHTRSDEQDQSAYDEVNTGFALRMGYPLSEYLRQSLSYTLRNDKISNVDPSASRFVREQTGSSLSSIVSQDLTYDVRDSKIDPTEGFITKLKTDIAGAGGDRHYYRAKLTGTQFYSPYEKIVLSLLGEVGFIDGFGEDVRINDRFFIGGDTLRGFAYGGIGPRDLTNGADDSLGGNSFARGSVELAFPTYVIPDDMGVKAHIFSDFGVVGKNDEDPVAGEIFRDDPKLRASVGVGFSWQSPFGLIRLDYAQPFLKQSYDDIQHIHFSFGTRF
ncbi:MAG: outer membrane protein assembly factor BamA [Proteobacteria bacterium]|jgi:outer membrane protein insertion porin family|nr:outer membrane protein assembly factor BamA [Alphaproteobacteria bacterium]NCC02886.1 outer membrane protein assembly factor BamA [Pseudomonadota bacterium]